jgi:transcriptional antiterminator RfaH
MAAVARLRFSPVCRSLRAFIWASSFVILSSFVIRHLELRLIMPAAGNWFCLRSQPKHEHIAAAHLRKMEGVEVFLPRVRFKRTTRQGLVWATEALFPNYLFARFDWQNSLRQVQAARGVSGVVHFGERWPVIAEAVIADLQRAVGTTELHTISAELRPGDTVQIADGAMRGLSAVVTRVMPSRERVAVLMDFLGRQTTIEVPANVVIKEGNARAAVFPADS